ncbi:MAG: hypothetical protein HWN66_20615 [Candidatus Helarchaeota archaeon]|nr:hypothetical protein [Candidatus Helarchaeota archaeon]
MERFLVIYIGDSANVIPRIKREHCSGNVEASALRKHVAREMGYKIRKEKRTTSNSYRTRIDLPDPRVGEQQISNYIQSGHWKYVLCKSTDEARDFQWYAIHKLNPLLNKDRKPWNSTKSERYQFLLEQLSKSVPRNCSELRRLDSGPGIYVLYHPRPPSENTSKQKHIEQFE